MSMRLPLTATWPWKTSCLAWCLDAAQPRQNTMFDNLDSRRLSMASPVEPLSCRALLHRFLSWRSPRP